jgi:hypothetical protein
MTVINIFSKAKNPRDYTNYDELIEMVNNIPADDVLTMAASEYCNPKETAHIFYNLDHSVGKITEQEIGMLNYLANMSLAIKTLNKELETHIPVALYSGIEASLNLFTHSDMPREASEGMDIYSNLMNEESKTLISKIRRLNILYQSTKIRYITSISERLDFKRFCVINENIFLTKEAHGLITLNTI